VFENKFTEKKFQLLNVRIYLHQYGKCNAESNGRRAQSISCDEYNNLSICLQGKYVLMVWLWARHCEVRQEIVSGPVKRSFSKAFTVDKAIPWQTNG